MLNEYVSIGLILATQGKSLQEVLLTLWVSLVYEFLIQDLQQLSILPQSVYNILSLSKRLQGFGCLIHDERRISSDDLGDKDLDRVLRPSYSLFQYLNVGLLLHLLLLSPSRGSDVPHPCITISHRVSKPPIGIIGVVIIEFLFNKGPLEDLVLFVDLLCLAHLKDLLMGCFIGNEHIEQSEAEKGYFVVASLLDEGDNQRPEEILYNTRVFLSYKWEKRLANEFITYKVNVLSLQ